MSIVMSGRMTAFQKSYLSINHENHLIASSIGKNKSMNTSVFIMLMHGVHKNLKLKFQDISRTFQDKNYVFPGQFLPVEIHRENQEVILICLLQLYKRNLHGGKTTMLYLNLSGHELVF